MSRSDRRAVAALTTLILLQTVMLGALFAGVRPHPPEAIPLFGIAPFIGASASIALAAILLGPLTDGAGRVLSVLAAAAALVSFGPQKYLDAQFAQIWPAVVLGQVAAAVLIVQVARSVGRSAPVTTSALGRERA